LVATPDAFVFRTPFQEEAARRAWMVDVPVGSGPAGDAA
jgi:hypothetical protein